MKKSNKKKAAPSANRKTKSPGAKPKGQPAMLPGTISSATPAGIRLLDPDSQEKDLVRQAMLPVSLISPSPYQPRREFDAAELEELANSLEKLGQLQPVVVRRIGEGFELIAGERRWRAAQQLGWQTVRAEVLILSDREAAEAAFVENFERKQLNAVEEAMAMRGLLQEHGFTQEELGERLKISQGQISNRIRLLELPKEWTKRIISGEISATHARHLLPFVRWPNILKCVEDLVEETPGMSERDFGEQLQRIVKREGKPLSGGFYDREKGAWVSVLFKPNEEQKKNLAVVKVDHGEPVCLNVPLWEQLQEIAEAKRERRLEAKELKEAEREASPEQQARKEAQKAEQFEKRLREFAVDWQRYLCVYALERTDEDYALAVITRALLWCALTNEGGSGQRYQIWMKILADHKEGYQHGYASPACLAFESFLSSDIEITQAAREFVRHCLWHADTGPSPVFSEAAVQQMAGWLNVDYRAAWKRERCGPLTERFYKMHDKSQLLELSRKWKLTWTEQATKAELVSGLMDRDQSSTAEIPTELLKVVVSGSQNRAKR